MLRKSGELPRDPVLAEGTLAREELAALANHPLSRRRHPPPVRELGPERLGVRLFVSDRRLA